MATESERQELATKIDEITKELEIINYKYEELVNRSLSAISKEDVEKEGYQSMVEELKRLSEQKDHEVTGLLEKIGGYQKTNNELLGEVGRLKKNSGAADAQSLRLTLVRTFGGSIVGRKLY